ncbi:MAG: FG-GAP repeat protein, partial [Phycisphaerae bacterium]|nr:FG-GAP repeat protein [Phycisphaerae bacterium]
MRFPKRILSATVLMIGGLVLVGGVNTAWGQCEADEFAKIFASDGTDGDYFGKAVSISGDCAVIGAEYDDIGASATGSAYVYCLEDSSWVQKGKLTASDAGWANWFGSSVSISGDVIVVGAFGDDDMGNDSGSAYVFVKPADGWASMTETAKLWSSNGSTVDRFGRSVSISGNVIVAGAAWDTWESGTAYVFVKPSGGWVDSFEDAMLWASDSDLNDFFGYSVAISGDTIVVGAMYNDDNGNKSGSAYIFEEPVGGWVNMTETAKLMPHDGAAEDEFGFSVAISGDTAVIGAPNDRNTHGSAYVFEKPAGGWADWLEWMPETAKLRAWGSTSEDYFGKSVSISGDIIVVGAYGDDDNGDNAGAAYAYKKPSGGWVDTAETFKMLASDGEQYDRMGRAVGISDGIAVIGSYKDRDDCGSAYLFHGIEDCNGNDVLDICDIAMGTSEDCLPNGTPDECELDCNSNAIPDECDIIAGTSEDCNANGIPDECDFASGNVEDCNANGIIDECELDGNDCNNNGVPDECDVTGGHNCCETGHGPQCSNQAIRDCVCANDPYCCEVDWDRICVMEVTSEGCFNCEVNNDCNANTIPDECDLAAGTSEDCNFNEVPDECDIADGVSNDCNGNNVPDECELQGNDCNNNNIPDECDITGGTSNDCNNNDVPDECDLDGNDCNNND